MTQATNNEPAASLVPQSTQLPWNELSACQVPWRIFKGLCIKCVFIYTHTLKSMPQKSPIYMLSISSQTRCLLSKLHTQSNILKAATQWLCHSDESWRTTRKAEVCILKWGPTPEVSSLMMVDRTFHSLEALFQIFASCTFCFHISITKALFLNPLFLLLTLEAYCLSIKTTECEYACLCREMGRKFATVYVLGPTHSI